MAHTVIAEPAHIGLGDSGGNQVGRERVALRERRVWMSHGSNVKEDELGMAGERGRVKQK